MANILQLNPPLAIKIPSQGKKGYAYLFIDYGIDNEVWGVADSATGEFWFYRTHLIRFDENITMGRTVPT
jgi:hypothetical protein